LLQLLLTFRLDFVVNVSVVVADPKIELVVIAIVVADRASVELK